MIVNILKINNTIKLLIIISLTIISYSCVKQKKPFKIISSQTNDIHILAVGDTMLADAALPYLNKYGYDYPFKKVIKYFTNADIIIGNLEAPVTNHTIKLDNNKKYTYKSNLKSLEAYKEFGFDIFCLANNHILDYGLTGLSDTLNNLNKFNIACFGAGKNYDEVINGKIININGIKIGFIGFMESFTNYKRYDYYAKKNRPGVLELNSDNLKKAIIALKNKADIVIVSIHWGINYKSITSNQKKWAKKAIDYGADIIIGHHPHIIQELQLYKNKPIIYSLGNFTFGTPGGFDRIDNILHFGFIADILIDNSKIKKIGLITIQVNNRKIKYQPVIADKEMIMKINELLIKKFKLNTELTDDRIMIDL